MLNRTRNVNALQDSTLKTGVQKKIKSPKGSKGLKRRGSKKNSLGLKRTRLGLIGTHKKLSGLTVAQTFSRSKMCAAKFLGAQKGSSGITKNCRAHKVFKSKNELRKIFDVHLCSLRAQT